MPRKLSETFMSALQNGFLAELRKKVIADKDLDLQIRDNYLNIYYKGNSLLKLAERTPKKYKVDINAKFEVKPEIQELRDEASVERFIQNIPFLKENIIRHGGNSLEAEYEQLIIRANKFEAKNNSEYFIVDRQYAANDEDRHRFDLTGFHWPRAGGGKIDQAPLCLLEVKFSLNQDIKNLHEQILRYYEFLRKYIAEFADEAQNMFRQKLGLGLINQNDNRLKALEALQFSPCIDEAQFVLILVDYNPHSKLLEFEKIKQLAFARQIKIFYTGFAMWERRLQHYPELEYHHNR